MGRNSLYAHNRNSSSIWKNKCYKKGVLFKLEKGKHKQMCTCEDWIFKEQYLKFQLEHVELMERSSNWQRGEGHWIWDVRIVKVWDFVSVYMCRCCSHSYSKYKHLNLTT